MGLDLAPLRTLLELRDRKERTALEAKRAAADHDAHEQVVWEQLEDNGVKSSTIDVGAPWGEVRFERPKPTIYSRVVDIDVLLESLKQSGRLDELTKPGIEKGRLNELVRECLDHGQSIPEGADYSEKKYIRIAGRTSS